MSIECQEHFFHVCHRKTDIICILTVTCCFRSFCLNSGKHEGGSIWGIFWDKGSPCVKWTNSSSAWCHPCSGYLNLPRISWTLGCRKCRRDSYCWWRCNFLLIALIKLVDFSGINHTESIPLSDFNTSVLNLIMIGPTTDLESSGWYYFQIKYMEAE